MSGFSWHVQRQLPQSERVSQLSDELHNNFLSKTGLGLSQVTAQQLCWQGFSEVLQYVPQVDLTPETAAF